MHPFVEQSTEVLSLKVHRKRTRSCFAYYGNVAWADLPQNVKDAWDDLGFGGISWTVQGMNKEREEDTWSDLDEEDRALAEIVGFTGDSWDCQINHYNGYNWTDIKNAHLTEYFETIGYNKVMWEEDEDANIVGKAWGEIEAKAQGALEGICWTQDLWDNYRTESEGFLYDGTFAWTHMEKYVRDAWGAIGFTNARKSWRQQGMDAGTSTIVVLDDVKEMVPSTGDDKDDDTDPPTVEGDATDPPTVKEGTEAPTIKKAVESPTKTNVPTASPIVLDVEETDPPTVEEEDKTVSESPTVSPAPTIDEGDKNKETTTDPPTVDSDAEITSDPPTSSPTPDDDTDSPTRLYYGNVTWDDLPLNVKDAWQAIGFTNPSKSWWQQGRDYDSIESKSWFSLNIENSCFQGNATIVGFTNETWDCHINHYDDYTWEELIAFDLNEHFETIGYNTSEMWEGDEETDLDFEDKEWDEIETEVQGALVAICWTEDLLHNYKK
eukprot:scaffold44029_cov49-Attheya_sp.AAC.1